MSKETPEIGRDNVCHGGYSTALGSQRVSTTSKGEEPETQFSGFVS